MTLTVTDMFCGAGGTSIGAAWAGLDIKLGLNHWRTAIETFGANHAGADTDCADISGTDPRRYPRTDILHASPECTNHSLAKGASRRRTDPSLFETDPERLRRLGDERSRATMWDVPRFAEYHRYDAVVVENVVEAHDWVMWPAWWQAMELLGYDGQVVSANSGILNYDQVPRVPQSRDRLYVVWTRKGALRPDVTIRPYAWCGRCTQVVESVQSWRNGKRWGRYRSQYDYRCPACTQLVEPPMAPAAQAIDWSLDAPRIGDRKVPLAVRTMERIQRGIDKYGPYLTAMVVPYTPQIPYPASVRPADLEGMPTLTTAHGGGAYALVYPYRRSNDVKPTDQPLDSVTTVDPFGLVVPLSRAGDLTVHARDTDRPLPTQTARQDLALAAPDTDVSMDARDWGFRMLDPAELGRGMGFPDSYVVHGNKRDQTRQYGNAVTPPISQILDTRILDALAR